VVLTVAIASAVAICRLVSSARCSNLATLIMRSESNRSFALAISRAGPTSSHHSFGNTWRDSFSSSCLRRCVCRVGPPSPPFLSNKPALGPGMGQSELSTARGRDRPLSLLPGSNTGKAVRTSQGGGGCFHRCQRLLRLFAPAG